MRFIKSLFSFCLFLPLFSFGQNITLSDSASVSILTCGVGHEVYSLFGHTAIRFRDPQQGFDKVYNYGAFDFEAPNFVLRFSKGDLQYFVTADDFHSFMGQYYYEKRSVFEQQLYLSAENKQALFNRLNQVMKSDARFYTYKFIDRNCTNMAVDIVNEILGGKIIFKNKNTEQTYRETLYPYFNGHFFEQLGTSIIFGTKVDQQATLLFLPIEFQYSLASAKYNKEPLSEKGKVILGFKKQDAPFSLWNNVYFYLAVLLLTVVINKNWMGATYLSILGLIGVFFSIAGMYSLHEELANNYNILLCNPVFLLLVMFHHLKKYKLVVGTALFCILAIALYLVMMMDKIHLFIVMPIVITNLIVLWRFAGRSMDVLKNSGSAGNREISK